MKFAHGFLLIFSFITVNAHADTPRCAITDLEGNSEALLRSATLTRPNEEHIKETIRKILLNKGYEACGVLGTGNCKHGVTHWISVNSSIYRSAEEFSSRHEAVVFTSGKFNTAAPLDRSNKKILSNVVLNADQQVADAQHETVMNQAAKAYLDTMASLKPCPKKI